MANKNEPIGKHSAQSREPVQNQPQTNTPHGYRPANQQQASYSQMRPATMGAAAGSVGEPMGWTDDSAGRERDPKKTIKIVGIIIAILLVIYLVGAFVFMGRFYPGSTLGGKDISMKSSSEVATMAESLSNNYSISVTGDGANFTITAAEANLTIKGSDVASSALAANNAFAWPIELFKSHDETQYLVSEYNSNGLETAVKKEVQTFNQDKADPVNATVVYAAASKSYTVQAEQAGTKLDVDKVLKAVDDALVDLGSKVTLTSSSLIQPTILSDDARLATASATANSYVKANITLVLGDTATPAGSISGDQISQWVTFDADMNVTFDQDAMNTWLNQLAGSFNTVGTSRTYTRPDGATFTVSGGTYGWEIDTDTLVSQVQTAVAAGSTETLTIPTVYEGAKWSGAGLQDWGAYVDVSISEQHARFYDASGTLQWETDVVTGIPDGEHDTPTGVWRLFNKESPSTLKGDIQQSTDQPEYETKVAYWMAFTYSGCGLHDATWQSSFGGSRYSSGYGSHGCVNLSYDAASALYGLISVGNAVVVHA